MADLHDRWVAERHNEYYYKLAHKEGYRSRASYKLMQIDDRFRIFSPGSSVVDLGACPGGWSQVAKERVGDDGTVIGVDLRKIRPLDGVTFIIGDITEDATMLRLLEMVGGKVDIVISDMAPNIGGAYSTDHARSVELCMYAVNVCDRILKKRGKLVTKVFMGDMMELYLRKLRSRFNRVTVTSPKASRPTSSEVYVVAEGFKGKSVELKDLDAGEKKPVFTPKGGNFRFDFIRIRIFPHEAPLLTDKLFERFSDDPAVADIVSRLPAEDSVRELFLTALEGDDGAQEQVCIALMDACASGYAEDSVGIDVLRLFADRGNMWCSLRLGAALLAGQGCEMNREEAVDRLVAMSDSPDVGADTLTTIGEICYYLGDMKGARALLSKAVSKGGCDAANDLGSMMEKGEGGDVDIAEAERLYRMAARGGNAVAMNNLGMVISRSFSRAKEAYNWFLMGYEAGYPPSMVNVGLCLLKGMGVTRSEGNAAISLQDAADNGEKDAMLALGHCYFFGNGVAPDPEKAAIWWTRAAERGNLQAKTMLGFLYSTGIGVEQDLAIATEYYLDAADKGWPDAQTNLGNLYNPQKGGPYAPDGPDPSRAYNWYLKAAKAGKLEAFVSLAQCHMYGIGAPLDIDEADRFLSLAEDNGLKSPITRLELRRMQDIRGKLDPRIFSSWHN